MNEQTVDATILFQIIGEQVVERRLMGQEMNRMQGVIAGYEEDKKAVKAEKKDEGKA